MEDFDSTLANLRLELGQVIDRKRYLENEASGLGQRAAVIEAKIQGMLEAAEFFKANMAASRKRQRKLSGPWQKMMQNADLIGLFTYDTLAAIAEVIGHEVGRDTLRSQMSQYRSAGLVEAVGEGYFQLTDLGRQAADIGDNIDSDKGLIGSQDTSDVTIEYFQGKDRHF